MMTSCQVDLSSGLIPGNLEIQDDDEDEIPEQPEPNQAKTDKATPAPEQDKALGQKKSSGGPAPCPSKGKAKSAPERTQVMDKRVTRSQGSAEELVLPISKRAQSKSKSPPLTGDAGESQPKRLKKTSSPRPGDQVPTMIVFGQLFEVFDHLDSIERVREVCTQEKASTPLASHLTGRRGKAQMPSPHCPVSNWLTARVSCFQSILLTRSASP